MIAWVNQVVRCVFHLSDDTHKTAWNSMRNAKPLSIRCPGSQNHWMVRVGRDLCGSSSPTPLPKQGHLQQPAQDFVQACLEYLQRRRLHNLPGQPGPQSRTTFFSVSTSLLSPLKSVFPFSKDSLPIFSSWIVCQKKPPEEILQSTSECRVQPTAGEPRSGVPLADGSCRQNSSLQVFLPLDFVRVR